MQAFQFQPFTAEQIDMLTSEREGETKIGQKISIDPLDQKVNFVILGISEDIGPQANLGMTGAINGFDCFLRRFLNMQNNRFLDAEKIAIAGRIIQNVEIDFIEQSREQVEKLDELVFEILSPWVEAGKIPVVIGGGHNNAYPIIRSVSTFLDEAIDVVNLDPHADCRPIEGRHSGNPFSYATMNGFLENYTVIGLHKAYNSEYILDFLDVHHYSYTFFEDLLSNPGLLNQSIEDICENTDKGIGVELDLDSIANMPSSAYTPSGFSLEQARFYVQRLSQSDRKKLYLHLPEGAPQNDLEEKIVGKALAYLVYDFISMHRN